MGNRMADPQKIKHRIAISSSNSTPDYPKGTKLLS